MIVLLQCFALYLLVALAKANTEKTIFLAPDKIALPNSGPSLANLNLLELSSRRSALHTSLDVAFANVTNPKGLRSWYILHDLEEHQRYELRICWPATQPSQFWIETFGVTEVLDTPSLIQDLASFSEQQQPVQREDVLLDDFQDYTTRPESVLFVRVWSAADFFTTKRHLMHNPPPVNVELILDPFALNVFPKSLLPTAAYIVVLTAGSWWVSGAVWSILKSCSKTKAHGD